MWVRADRRRLRQVLGNLLQNAITHSPAGSAVEVAAAPDGAQALLTVRDRGAGIAEEHLPRIWDRFYRIDPSRSRASGGMGLGLAVVRQLVEGMGGTVSVASAPGAGSTFTVRLPSASG